MYLINEQDDVAVSLLDLFQYGLQSLFKFTAGLGPGDQSAHVQFNYLLVFQVQRNVLLHDPPGQSLNYRGLADTWFTDQYRIVLGLTGKYLDDSSDFFITADDRVDLAVDDILYQIMSVLLQCFQILFAGRFIHLLGSPSDQFGFNSLVKGQTRYCS